MAEVETFEVTEVSADGKTDVEHADELMDLAERMGLDGQMKFLAPEEGEDAKVNPYRKMSREEDFVYSTLCAQVTQIEKYDDSIIPLRVLQVAAHAKNHFKFLEVWHETNSDVEDPVLVGTDSETWHSSREKFILARWGAELAPFAELAILAVRKWRAKTKQALAKIKSEVQQDMDALEDFDPLLESRDSTPAYSGYKR